MGALLVDQWLSKIKFLRWGFWHILTRAHTIHVIAALCYCEYFTACLLQFHYTLTSICSMVSGGSFHLDSLWLYNLNGTIIPLQV